MMTIYCHRDTVDDISETQLNVLKRHFPSFAVIYKYPISSTLELEKRLAEVTNICSASGHTLVFKCDGDLAPLNLYLPLGVDKLNSTRPMIGQLHQVLHLF